MFSYRFLSISCLKCTVNSYFHLIRNKSLLTNDFDLTVPDLYMKDCMSAALYGDDDSKKTVISVMYSDNSG